uniref:Uncharacterized protein n=1 Tax=Tanacetum cinerariifolium TaxID=118510 RepID=A0A699HUD0_TANCI|nr:hypothetical protein [Tanacetum cinerariifolium]
MLWSLLKKRLKIKRCNARISFTKPQKEETYQVTLEALKLSPCYPAFQITAKVPEIYMHQLWNTIKKIGKTDGYNFKLDKKKCRVDTKELGYSGKCDMLSTIRTDQIHQPWMTFATVINKCTLKFISKIEDYQKYGALIPDGIINQDIKDSKAYKTYLDYATGKVPPKKARKFKKTASPKLKTVPASPKEPTHKGKRVKRAAKKATTAPTIGVVIRDTPGKSVSKKKVSNPPTHTPPSPPIFSGQISATHISRHTPPATPPLIATVALSPLPYLYVHQHHHLTDATISVTNRLQPRHHQPPLPPSTIVTPTNRHHRLYHQPRHTEPPRPPSPPHLNHHHYG